MGNQAEPEDGGRPASVRAVELGRVASLALLAFGTAWDLAGTMLETPPAWHSVSYAAIGAAVLIGLLAAISSFFAPVQRSRVGGLFVLLMVAASLVIRGHHEIPPDPPLIGVQVFAVLAIAASRWRARRLTGTR